MAYDPDTALGGPQHDFPVTRHSLIEAATQSREALGELAALYWKPAYKHVRIKWRRSNEEAKDLVQAFFAALVERKLLAAFDPAKGRLRTWMRACLDHFVLKQYNHVFPAGDPEHFDTLVEDYPAKTFEYFAARRPLPS